MSGNNERIEESVDDRPPDLDFRYTRDWEGAEADLNWIINFIPDDAITSADFVTSHGLGEHLHLIIQIPIGYAFDRRDDEDE